MKLGTALRNSVMGTFGHLFDGGTLRLYSGAPPATPDANPAGTLLVNMRLPVIAFRPPADGGLVIAGTWFASVAASGTAGCFQLMNLAGTLKAVGTVTATGGGGDIILSTASLTVGGVVQLTGFTLTLPQGV